MIGFFIALISGALMSIQGVFNTQVTKASSIWTASAFVQFLALLVGMADSIMVASSGEHAVSGVSSHSGTDSFRWRTARWRAGLCHQRSRF